MHQLTKDPSALGGPRTSASPERDMTRYELVRYLGYCSEMLSLASKAAAVYAEKVPDPSVVDAVGDIERLSTNLARRSGRRSPSSRPTSRTCGARRPFPRARSATCTVSRHRRIPGRGSVR